MSKIDCPRKKSAMTPCVANDGHIATVKDSSGRDICLGCEKIVADLFKDLVAKYVEIVRER